MKPLRRGDRVVVLSTDECGEVVCYLEDALVVAFDDGAERPFTRQDLAPATARPPDCRWDGE